MSDFLTRLALRQLGQIATIEPRVAPLYEGAKETRDFSFVEDSEHRPVTNVREGVAMPEKTANQTPARLVARGADPIVSEAQHLVQTPGGSDESTPRLDAQSSTAKSRSSKAGPFTVEASSATISSAAAPPVSFSRRPETDLETTESRPRQPMPVAPMTRIAPVAPTPLVQPSHSGSTEHPSEFTAPAVLGSEEDRRSKQAQGDKETPVHVTIGRIEVTAMTAAAPAKRAPARKQTMSLDDYLARRRRRDR